MNLVDDNTLLDVHRLNKTYSNGNGGLRALRDLSFQIGERSFICIVGPSGCGKTTLLRLLAGLIQPTSGRVLFHGEPMLSPRRRIGFVFQDANLMPWRSAMQNVALPLELDQQPARVIQRKSIELLEMVGLGGFEESYPRDLSGGMAQRVAIARALIHNPELLLLDEPFGQLDALTREKLALELTRIYAACQVTVLMVTHSIPEAILLADRVIALSPRPGEVRLDLPVDLPRPRSMAMTFTPEFGSMVKEIRSAIGAS
jgi:NitT/TauT family transport system ATP-binding protein